MKKILLLSLSIILTALGLTSCGSASYPMLSTTQGTAAYGTALWEGNAVTIWEKLQVTSSAKLANMQETDPVKKAWIDLALIAKRNSTNTPFLAREVSNWRTQNPNHPANQLLPSNSVLTQLETTPPPQRIALLLPQSGSYGASGQTVREGFLNAYYANPNKTSKQNIKFYDSNSGDIVSLYQQAVANGADFVIGPLVKQNVQQLMNAESFPTTVLALNYTDNRWSLPENFYEFGLLPEDEAGQIATRAKQARLSRAIIIAPQNAWGNRMANALATRWQSQGGRVQETWYFRGAPDFNQEIATLLHVNPDVDKRLTKAKSNKEMMSQQRRQDFDVIFLIAQPNQARAIVPLLRYYYADNIPIYATSAVYSGTPNPTKDVDLNGVIVCDIPWSKSGRSADRLYAVGQDAYLLSQTLQRLIWMPYFSIYGTTGALTLSNRQIHRRLPCMAFQNGRL